MEKSDSTLTVFNKRGQSVVEYLFMLALVMTLVIVVLKSPLFETYLGPNSPWFTKLRSYWAYSYQYCLEGSATNVVDYTGINHDSYYSAGDTRFFRSRASYP